MVVPVDFWGFKHGLRPKTSRKDSKTFGNEPITGLGVTFLRARFPGSCYHGNRWALFFALLP